jgi:hypothetical protein
MARPRSTPKAFEFKRRAGEVAVRRWATARALQAPLCVLLAQHRTALPRTAFPLTATISHPPPDVVGRAREVVASQEFHAWFSRARCAAEANGTTLAGLEEP